MDSYLLLKLLHIISAVVLAGTGIGIAFFMLMAGRSGNPQAVAVTARHVVLADWIFTTPAIVIQFITGLWLMKILHYSFSSAWFLVVISLFIFIGCCWVPVVFVQYKLKNIAETREEKSMLGTRFRKLMTLWTALGIPAFLGIAVMFWLMVFKPLAVT
jgi:uncharacterized membrane protein